MALPDFLLIGAMKCGTSTLQAQLARQAGVFMTTPKEPNFFSDDPVYAKGRAWYEALFADASDHDLKGEASTHYTKLPTYPKTIKRMQSALPAPRLIYMIRNPLDRAVSHYIHGWSVGEMGAQPTQAFEAHPTLVDYGRFAMQIHPYIVAYGAENIFLTSLEQIRADADAEFARICDFLSLPPTAAWQHDLAPQNVSAQRVKPLPLQGLLVYNPIATALRRFLIPQALRNWVKRARSMQDRPSLTPEHQKALQSTFLEDRAQLATLFPNHPALTLCYPFAET